MQIMSVGDCNTCGVGQLTIIDALRQQLEQTGLQSIVVSNLGHGMITTREGIQRILRSDGTVDVAMINFGLVDAWITTIPGVYIPYFPDNLLKKTCRRVLKFLKKKLRSPLLRQLVPLGPVVSSDEFVANIRKMVALLRSRNPAVMVIIWSTPSVANDDRRNEGLRRYNELLKSVAATERAQFLDSDVVLAEVALADRFLDGVHLSEIAVRQIASAIAEYLLALSSGTASQRLSA